MSYPKGWCNRFKQISKEWFYQTTVAFYQKSIFFFLIPFTNILIYGIFSGLFLDNFDWFFFLKIMVAKMHDTILQSDKVIIICRMHQKSAWQHEHLSTCAFQDITKSSSAAGCTTRWLLMSADAGCVLQLMMTL